MPGVRLRRQDNLHSLQPFTDEISEKFPWYKRLDALMGTSPVVNRSAVAHSQTRVDLSVLDRDGEVRDPSLCVARALSQLSGTLWPNRHKLRR